MKINQNSPVRPLAQARKPIQKTTSVSEEGSNTHGEAAHTLRPKIAGLAGKGPGVYSFDGYPAGAT